MLSSQQLKKIFLEKDGWFWAKACIVCKENHMCWWKWEPATETEFAIWNHQIFCSKHRILYELDASSPSSWPLGRRWIIGRLKNINNHLLWNENKLLTWILQNQYGVDK